MKTLVIQKFGGPEVFEEKEMPRPAVAANQVLIEVRATSVNPLDYKLRQGDVPYFTHAFPAILHGDVAGIVRETGAGVSGLKPGDEVYACAGGVRGRQGALAELMVADADLVALKPRTLDFASAAALPLVSITAWEALEESGALAAGTNVLIFGGTGGVGHIAIQLAKRRGAIVHALVGSREKARVARELGADHCILYREEPLESAVKRFTEGRGFDLVFDTIGDESFKQALAAARPRGTVVSIAARGTFDMLPAFGKALRVQFVNMTLPMATGLDMKRQGDILRELASLADSGGLRPLLAERRFSLWQAAQAHAHAERRDTIGKVVLTLD